MIGNVFEDDIDVEDAIIGVRVKFFKKPNEKIIF